MNIESFTVQAVKGGWVLDWRGKRPERSLEQYRQWPQTPEPETSGREIYTTKKALEKRLRELV